MPKRLILYVDNDEELQLRAMLERLQTNLPCIVLPAGTVDDGKRQIDEHAKSLDLVITDMHFGDHDPEAGLRIVEHAALVSRQRSVFIPVIVLTGKGGVNNAVSAMELGAFSYVEKGLENDGTMKLLLRKVEHALKRRRLELALRRKTLDDKAKARKIKRDLERARVLQASLQPRDDLTTAHWHAGGRCDPCDELGGDFFSFSLGTDEGVSIIVGDAIGHGVPAALLAAMLRAAIDSARALGQGAEEVRVRLLQSLALAPPSSATLFYAHTDVQGQLSYFSAGHPDAFLLRNTGGIDRLPSTGQLLAQPLLKGLGAPLATRHAEFGVGDRLVVYTDGITEASAGSKKEFGPSRLADIAQRSCGLGVDAALVRLFNEVAQFSGERALDDRTIVIVERRA